MASNHAAQTSKSWIPVALAAFVCESVAWVWVAYAPGLSARWSALGMGVLGLLLAMAAGWMLLNLNQRGRVALRRAQTAAARAVEHERATERAQQEAEKATELLVTALDALPISIAIFDQNDRQVIRNQCLDELFQGLFAPDTEHETFETMLRRELRMGLLPEARGREDAWVAKRLSERGNQVQPTLQQHANDRWIHTYEVRTRQGFTVVARAEVTDLVRKEQLLEQANAQLSRQSATDGLTGIANRRVFDETLATEWLRAARSGSTLGLLMVDIDHFKRFNDHYGHLAGDECLRRVTGVLSACVRRAGELLARYGGEEFVMLLPGADLAQAVEMAHRCLERITREALPHGSSPTAAHVTFSIGVAEVRPSADKDPESLVNAADTAMYRAKMGGRARYAVADIADWEIDKDAPRSRAGDLV